MLGKGRRCRPDCANLLVLVQGGADVGGERSALKITRKRVNHILGDARLNCFVQATFASRTGPYYELEAALVSTFGLRQAIVVPSRCPARDVRPLVGASAASPGLAMRQFPSIHYAINILI